MKRKESAGHASRKRRSDSSTVRNSGGSPKRTTNSAARSRANFLASPRTEPCERRSNSARLLETDQPRRPTIKKKEKETCEEKQAAAQCTPWASGACVPWDRSSHRIAVTLAGSQSHANTRDFHFPHSFYNYYALTLGFRLTIRYIGVNSCNSLSVSLIHKHIHIQTLA